MLDFNCSIEALQANIFSTYSSTINSRFYARSKANIVIYNNHLYVRSTKSDLTLQLQEILRDIPPEWLMEQQYVSEISSLLSRHNLHIQSCTLFFIPKMTLHSTINNDQHFVFYQQKDIELFKADSRIKMSFDYSKEEPDLLGLGYYNFGNLVAICGAIKNGLYTCDIGVEILDTHYMKKGLATTLVTNLVSQFQGQYPDIIPVYSTALSHVSSMNVAIYSNFKIGWMELMIN